MAAEASEFVLTICDNGRGITPQQQSGLHSLGLLGMRERAHLVGGEIKIMGNEGGGTVVTVRVPTLEEQTQPAGNVADSL
jgi:two-component system, NarL family, sensor histidine kinase UhpB